MGTGLITDRHSLNPAPRVFHGGLLALLALSVILHFFGLSRFNMLVFDEVFYAKYGHNYFHHLAVFDVHPPLGKLLIGAGMWIADALGYAGQLTNTLTGAERAPWAYRWVDAGFGSMLPLLATGVAWELTRRWRVALLSGLFVLLAGLFLVEARYALINIFMVVFGLTGHWLWLRGLSVSSVRNRYTHWLLAGLALGACLSVKWNGLSFLGVIWAMTGLAWIAARYLPSPPRFARLHWQGLIACFVVVPALLYGAQWTPHLRINDMSFQEAHAQMLRYHQNLKDGPSEHPYCSRWTIWPLMIRPISYLYEAGRDAAGPLPPITEKVPQSEQQTVYVVHALINPLLTWWSCVALLGLAAAFVFKPPRAEEPHNTEGRWPLGYLLLAFASGWLPWALVGRCQFLYLYMPSLAFAMVATAWAVDVLMSHGHTAIRMAGYAVLASVSASFVFFLPIYLGLPLQPASFYTRMWLSSWV